MSRAGTRPLPTLVVNDVEYVALDELAAVFPLSVGDDAAARAITVTWRGGRTVALTPDQALASVGGRLVSLPSAPIKIGGKWFVPVEFIGRAIALIAQGRVELRKASRLVIAGDLRVPRVSVRHEVAGQQARVTIEIAPPAPHTVIQEQGRLLVRFDADAVDVAVAPFASQGFVQSVHAADTGAALVVELGPRFASFRASDIAGDASTARLVIDVFGALETGTPVPGSTTPTPSAPDVPVLPAPSAGLRTVVLDAGHGGDDTGAKGTKGTLEKDLALALTRRLKSAIESRLGVRVLLTREDDRRVGADERASLANNNKADLFVSLHLSASGRKAASGASIFVLATDASPADAQAAAAGPPVAMPVFGGGTREVDVILWTRAQVRHASESAAFAQLVEAELRRVTAMHPRAVQAAPLRVLVGANMPAVLVELGYLSNPDEEARLLAPDAQAKIAQALLEAIVRYDQRAREQAGAPGGTR